MTDAPHPLEVELATHGAWARRLARSLTRDEERADDAAHEAWLAALERGGSSRAWLAQVVRNAVRRLGRADGRRTARERASAREEALPSAAELAAEAELQRDLVAAVLALEEPYLSTLVLRFYRDLPPAEIARLQDVPAGTVRSRLHRGLAELRARLDARYGDRAAWSAALATLTPLPGGAEASSASTHAPGGLGTKEVAAATAAGGGVAMGIKLKLAFAGAALVAGTLFVLRDGGAEVAPELARREAGMAAELVGGPPPPREQETAKLAASELAREAARVPASAPAAATPRIRVRVVDRDAAAVAGASVHVTPAGAYEPVLAEAVTGKDGRVSLALDGHVSLAPDSAGRGRVRLHWSAPDRYGGHQDRADLEREIELVLGWPAAVEGVVRDAATGAPLAGARISAHEVAATSDAAGRYRLGGLLIGAQIQVHARRAGYLERAFPIVVPESGTHPLDVELEPAEMVVVQIVARASGEPLAGAHLREYAEGPALATTDERGLARLGGRVGSELAVVAGADGYASLRWSVQVREAGDDAPVARLPLARLGWIEGIVRDPEGDPLAGTEVSGGCGECDTRALDVAERERFGLRGHLADEAPEVVAQTDEAGRYRLPVLACGHSLTVTARHPDHPGERVSPVAPPPPGGTVRVDPRLRRGGTIRGRATRNGEPWTSGEVIARGAADGWFARAPIDPEGRFELVRMPPELVHLELSLHLRRTVVASADVVVDPGGVVEQDLAWREELATISGRVVDHRGEPRADVHVGASSQDERGRLSRSIGARTAADGTFVLHVPATKVYRVGASLSRAIRRNAPNVAAGTEGLLLVLPDPGTVRLQLLDESGEPPGPLQSRPWPIRWGPSGSGLGQYGDAAIDLKGRATFEVEPGAVDLSLDFSDDGYLPVLVRDVAVAPGGEAEVVVRLVRGVEALLSLGDDGSDASLLRRHLVFLLEDSELDLVTGPLSAEDPARNRTIRGIAMRIEEPRLAGRLVTIEEPGLHVTRGLPPGRYRLRAHPDDVAFEPESFDLPAGDAPIRVGWRAR